MFPIRCATQIHPLSFVGICCWVESFAASWFVCDDAVDDPHDSPTNIWNHGLSNWEFDALFWRTLCVYAFVCEINSRSTKNGNHIWELGNKMDLLHDGNLLCTLLWMSLRHVIRWCFTLFLFLMTLCAADAVRPGTPSMRNKHAIIAVQTNEFNWITLQEHLR